MQWSALADLKFVWWKTHQLIWEQCTAHSGLVFRMMQHTSADLRKMQYTPLQPLLWDDTIHISWFEENVVHSITATALRWHNTHQLIWGKCSTHHYSHRFEMTLYTSADLRKMQYSPLQPLIWDDNIQISWFEEMQYTPLQPLVWDDTIHISWFWNGAAWSADFENGTIYINWLRIVW